MLQFNAIAYHCTIFVINAYFLFCDLLLPRSCLKRSRTELIRMSSECAGDSVKRKVDEISDCSESVSKKPLISDEKPLDDIIVKALGDTNRVRKPKKVVFLLCYLGKEFYGMQRNSNVSTVEEELFKALLETNVILKSEFDFPKTMKFQRAARTDKGVSAVRQIVSLKIPLKEISDALPEKINKHLPPEIRLVAVRRVTQSFDAKIACDARTYSYMLPTFAFAPNIEGNSEEYRIDDEKIKEVNKFLQNYIGTHNFYNFTSGRLPGDPSCKRYILSCECGPPFESCGLELSVIKIKGQSFMLHQIRKMVGLTIAFMRNLADDSILEKIWLKERIDIPKAPGLGLMLEELHYDWYDSKYGSDGMHEPLKWDAYNEFIETFKQEKICANIAKTEREEKSMLQWLETLPHHSYDVRDAGPPEKLPPKGPIEATISDDLHQQQSILKAVSNSSVSASDIDENLCSDEVNSNTTSSELSTNICKKETEIKCEC
ncbi:tRNA pseudouridine synthase A-like isoform X2 [Stegodyphus dumicola]|uniref:tRNA pseudouridine synthase A-like isoform X2 n=1 Tax=Stegodyphus dumicola TaxID=202533 RepID=UPI0015AC968D|nr:tRNA pseudouridine synthase A-like isoform X2 [Stegodyphus dumicola]